MSKYGVFLVQIQENTDQKKLCIGTFFTQCIRCTKNEVFLVQCTDFITFIFSSSASKNSHRRCSKTLAALKTFVTFKDKHPCWSLFLINFIKKILQHRRLPVNIAKFLRIPIWSNISEQLPLYLFTHD